jgi:high frequency lysogenization protein
MLFTPNQDKVLALAGLVQSGKLVTQLAAEPEHDEAALRASAGSLLCMHPESIDEVFGDTGDVYLGLETMASLLKGKGLQSMLAKELIRYLMSMDQLADRLSESASTRSIIEKGLYDLNSRFSTLLESSIADQQDDAMAAEYDAFYAGVGTLYQKSLSQLAPKIIVRGAEGYLQDEQSVSRVRTALFAGVRAAYLWHQQGARRWQLVFSRRAYAEMAGRLMLNP